jgi:predicted RNase H-like HicB family nuclease
MTTKTVRYVYWEADEGGYIGYLEEWPDYMTQGEDIAELEVMLRDLYETFTSGKSQAS